MLFVHFFQRLSFCKEKDHPQSHCSGLYVILQAFLPIGTGLLTLSHSPLKALMSQFWSSGILLVLCLSLKPGSKMVARLTLVDNLIRVVEVDTVITVREDMHVVILHTSDIQFVK